MSKLVECCVCGKSFAITDAELKICKQIAKELEGDDAKTKFMCKYCQKMIKPKVN